MLKLEHSDKCNFKLGKYIFLLPLKNCTNELIDLTRHIFKTFPHMYPTAEIHILSTRHYASTVVKVKATFAFKSQTSFQHNGMNQVLQLSVHLKKSLFTIKDNLFSNLHRSDVFLIHLKTFCRMSLLYSLFSFSFLLFLAISINNLNQLSSHHR